MPFRPQAMNSMSPLPDAAPSSTSIINNIDSIDVAVRVALVCYAMLCSALTITFAPYSTLLY